MIIPLLLVFSIISAIPLAAAYKYENTTSCAAAPVPFNINDWMFHLPSYAPKSLITAERISNPMNHYENTQEHIQLLNFFISDCKKYKTESNTTYFADYVRHYPTIIPKFYCALVGRDRPLGDFMSISGEAFYSYLIAHPKDWDWLTAENVKEPAIWSMNDKQLVIDTIIADSSSRGLVTAGWDTLYTFFTDLMEQLSNDFITGDYTNFNSFRVPVHILPATFLTTFLKSPPKARTIVITPNDLMHMSELASKTVMARILGHLKEVLEPKSKTLLKASHLFNYQIKKG